MKEYSYLILNLVFQTFPFFGVEPTILNEHGEELEGEAEGYLVSLSSILQNFIYPCKTILLHCLYLPLPVLFSL